MELASEIGVSPGSSACASEDPVTGAVLWPVEAGLARYEALKRALDVSLAAVLLLILLPVLLLCALAVRLDSPGPVLFRQERIGRHGRAFRMLKFRSMYDGVNSEAHRRYVTDFIQGAVDRQGPPTSALYKLSHDSRVTRVGKWLRLTSLDELPQLWNVLRGDMSLVGPRPPLEYEVAQYQPRHLRRLVVRPGITGLWQVYGRSVVTFEEMIEMDLEYIRRRSILLDLRLLVLTIPAVLYGRGAR